MSGFYISRWGLELWPECPWPDGAVPCWVRDLLQSSTYSHMDIFLALVANYGSQTATLAALDVGKTKYRHGLLIAKYLAPVDDESDDEDDDIDIESAVESVTLICDIESDIEDM